MVDCHHYSTKTKDDITYCLGCEFILEGSPYWSGKITIGQMSNNFEISSIDFDIKDLIETSIGASVALVNVIQYRDVEKRYWAQSYQVQYKIGPTVMIANLTDLSQDVRYTATDRKYEEETVA